MTFTFFTNGTCDGAGTGKGTVALVAGVAHPSQASGALQTGDYAFRATYNGDGNFNVSTSACEPFHVNKAAVVDGDGVAQQRDGGCDRVELVGCVGHERA